MIYPTAIAEAKIAIAAAKNECPYLTTEGIGAYQPFGHLVFSGPKFEEDRNNFSLEQVATAIAFLRRCRLTRSRAARLSSYGLKHAAERWGKAAGMAPYVSNGELIAAALFLGFPVEFNTTCVNALVGVDKRSLRKLEPRDNPPMAWCA
jgi:hypothetical protein